MDIAANRTVQEVSIEYMKIAEREEMIREEAIARERINTERERKRADTAEEEIRRLKEELKRYRH